MRGAKPSSGLVHLHKSFIEGHFAGRDLPQNVSVLACIDGKQLATVLPGQVYSTSCGSDHWLLGLQLIFKAYKNPVITRVDKTGDNEVTVSITTQGLQDKYSSADPQRQVELQQAMEAAALKFAQTAVMRKEGRLQITGPNINIPKKQLRAQWPGILDTLTPQDVQAHIFVDSADQYISCAARIILTKAKAEPVFYLSGLSQLLRTYSGAFVTLELFPDTRIVRLHIATRQHKVEGPSLSAETDTSSAAQPQRASLATADTGRPMSVAAGSVSQVADSGMALTSGGEGWEHTLTSAGRRHEPGTSRRSGDAASPYSNSAGGGDLQRHEVKPVELAATYQTAAQTAAGVAIAASPLMQSTGETMLMSQPYGFAGHHWPTQLASSAAAIVQQHPWPDPGMVECSARCLVNPQACGGEGQQQLHGVLGCTGETPASLDQQAAAQASHSIGAAKARLTTDTCMQAEAAPVVLDGDGCHKVPTQGVKGTGVSVDSAAGLWLLADHAAQLQAVASSGDLAADAAAVASTMCSGTRFQKRRTDTGTAATPPVRVETEQQTQGKVAVSSKTPRAAAKWDESVDPAVMSATAAAAAMYAAGFDPATTGESIHPAALPQLSLAAHHADHVGDTGTAAYAYGYQNIEGQHAAPQSKRRRTSSTSGAAQVAPAADGRPRAAQSSPMLLGRIAQDRAATGSAVHTGNRHHTPALSPDSAAFHAEQQSPGEQQERLPASPYLQPVLMGFVPPVAAATGVMVNGHDSGGVLTTAAGYDLPGDSGAVAYVHRLSPFEMLMGSSGKHDVGLPQVPYGKQHMPECPGADAPRKKLGSAGGAETDWDQGQYCSPSSGASSLSKVAASHMGGPASLSPAATAAGPLSNSTGNAVGMKQAGYDPLAAAQAVDGAYNKSIMNTSALSMLAAQCQQPSLCPQQQQAWSKHASPEAGKVTSALSAYGQLAAGLLGTAVLGAEQPVAVGEACSGIVRTGSLAAASAQDPHIVCAENDAAAIGDWPDLPDADNLMLVGKGLVQVMNLLGAGSAARLSLTRALRAMSSQDREWLLSITYPHLQDSCRRRAVAELKMILNEIVGMDCFAPGIDQ